MKIYHARQKPELLEEAYRLFCEHRYRAWQLATFKSAFMADVSLISIDVVDTKTQLCGYLLARISLDEAEIDDISVCKQYRRLGYASSLLSELISTLETKQIKRILLEVNSNNSHAISLYQRFGFRQIGMRKNYYDVQDNQKEDALVMLRES
ncbi:ribosomal protein S18-alanine N-acetyltransferase [Glaciecola petra]|uniref:[Ribosomal protein bS18]-alanine N-acetyltransferase n=1 Tax=Glaciecola petra TaxID=3075602 RepID=A0ABU2ZPB2_9ALTE|nr:ribosomal protein S18-alanine N-acetyltransferase [Aestuariibacter sp. P117]MDT0593888.1 ribosomal protein S18-alanine N-acetyltransferase [Aestuariibacter sp. P117]